MLYKLYILYIIQIVLIVNNTVYIFVHFICILYRMLNNCCHFELTFKKIKTTKIQSDSDSVKPAKVRKETINRKSSNANPRSEEIRMLQMMALTYEQSEGAYIPQKTGTPRMTIIQQITIILHITCIKQITCIQEITCIPQITPSPDT